MRTDLVTIWLLAALMLSAAGCAQFRQPPPPDPVPPPPPVVVEARPPEEVMLRPPSRTGSLLALAETAMIVGLDEGADLLLGEFIRTAPVEDREERARALVLRALVSLRRGGESGRQAATAFLLAARQLEPLGASTPGIDMTLELIATVEAREADLQATRSRLAASRRREGEEQAGADALRSEVESLKQQLNELKDIHLQIESDKQDAPSR